MAKSKQFRNQSSAVSAVSEAGVNSYYTDASGVLKFIRPGGDIYFAGQTFTQILSGNFPGQLGTFVTGLQPAVTGSLGSTKTFFVVNGPSGGNFAIPAYSIT